MRRFLPIDVETGEDCTDAAMIPRPLRTGSMRTVPDAVPCSSECKSGEVTTEKGTVRRRAFTSGTGNVVHAAFWHATGTMGEG